MVKSRVARTVTSRDVRWAKKSDRCSAKSVCDDVKQDRPGRERHSKPLREEVEALTKRRG